MNITRDDLLKQLHEYGVSDSRLLKLDKEIDQFIDDFYQLNSDKELLFTEFDIDYITIIKKDSTICLRPLKFIVSNCYIKDNKKITQDKMMYHLPLSENQRNKILEQAELNIADWKWVTEFDKRYKTITKDIILYHATKKKRGGK